MVGPTVNEITITLAILRSLWQRNYIYTVHKSGSLCRSVTQHECKRRSNEVLKQQSLISKKMRATLTKNPLKAPVQSCAENISLQQQPTLNLPSSNQHILEIKA